MNRRDLAFLRQQLQASNEAAPEQLCEQVLEAEAARGQEEGTPLEAVMKPRQLEAVRRLPLQRRISRVAGILRTHQFMHRYHTDLSTRDARMQELEARWYESSALREEEPGKGCPVTSRHSKHAVKAA